MLNSTNDDQFTSQVAGILKSFNDAPRKYYDYRQSVKDIIDNLGPNQDDLERGAKAITQILNLAKIKINDEQPPTSSTNSSSHLNSTSTTKTTSKSANQDPLIKPYYYTFHRELSGGLITSTIKPSYRHHLSESLVRRFNLEDNDILNITINSRDPVTGQLIHFKINQVVKHQPDLPSRKITVFPYGIIEYDASSNHYKISKDYHGERLSNANSAMLNYVIPRNLTNDLKTIKNGALADLAWFDDHPEIVKIRWVHDPNQAPKHPTTKKHSAYVNNNDHNSGHDAPLVETTLDYNLHQQTVAIINGDALRAQEFQALCLAHNAKCKVLDAFKVNNNTNYIQSSLTDVDIVIMVQNYNTHKSSQALTDAVKDFNLKFAIANSMGIQSVERAIYRADQELPAYDSSQNQIDYPLKNQTN